MQQRYVQCTKESAQEQEAYPPHPTHYSKDTSLTDIIHTPLIYLHNPLHLKKPLQPPHLKHALPQQHSDLENTPPLDPSIRALSRIAVRTFTDDDVGLFVFDLGEEGGELFYCYPIHQLVRLQIQYLRLSVLQGASRSQSRQVISVKQGECEGEEGGEEKCCTFYFQGILRRLALRHIHYPMHVEADFLCRCRPMLVAEAVDVFAIGVGVEAMVAGGDGAEVMEIVTAGVLDL